MTDVLTKPKSGPEYGVTTWHCACGASAQTREIWLLPLGWISMEMKIGMGKDNRQEEQTLCAKCAFAFRVGPALRQARRLLP